MAQPSRTRRFLSAFIQPLTFVIGFPLAFASATHAPTPHDLAIVLAGPPTVVSETAASLDTTDEFSVTHTATATEAEDAVFTREAVGSIEIQPVQDLGDPSAPPTFAVTTYIASGGGVAATEVVRHLGAGLAAQYGTLAEVVDVAPLSDEDGTGTGLFFLLSYVSLGGYLVIISLLQFAPTARLRTQYLAAGVNAILAPLLVFSLSAVFVGGYGAGFGELAALLGTAALYVFTVSAIAILIAQFLGKVATVGVMVVIVFLGFPGSGGTIPASMMPPFWQGVHEVFFSSAALESFRSIVYFDGNGVGRWLPQLVAWTVTIVLLTVVVHLRRRAGAGSHHPSFPTLSTATQASDVGASSRSMNNPLVAIVGTALMPLFFMVLLTTSFVSASHSPTPNNLPITIAGTDAVTNHVSVAITAETGPAFAITTTTSPSSARMHVVEQDSVGAILVNDIGVTIVKASAAGVTAAATVARLGNEVAAELELPVTIHDAAPLAEHDATGTSLFLLLVACTVGGFLAIIGPSQVRSHLSSRMMLATSAIAAVVIPVLSGAILSIFVGGLGASFDILAAVLGIAMIYTFTVGLIATLFHQLLGVGSVFPVMIFAVALNLPSTGGMSPASMLPQFWQGLHSFWFGSGAFEAMRSTLYFGGATTGQWLAQILAWTGIILVLVIGTSMLNRRGRVEL